MKLVRLLHLLSMFLITNCLDEIPDICCLLAETVIMNLPSTVLDEVRRQRCALVLDIDCQGVEHDPMGLWHMVHVVDRPLGCVLAMVLPRDLLGLPRIDTDLQLRLLDGLIGRSPLLDVALTHVLRVDRLFYQHLLVALRRHQGDLLPFR